MSFRKRKSKGVVEADKVARKKGGEESSEEEDVGVIKTVNAPRSVASSGPTGSSSSSSSTTTTTTKRSDAEVLPSAYASTREAAAHEYGGGATASSEMNTDTKNDARALLEKNILLNAGKDGTKVGDGIYRGMAAQKSFVRKDIAQVGGNKQTGTQGPLRAPTFLRAVSQFDYQPDVCKDYKTTGFCGFGDSCKFLHAREDYKAGHQLEKEWDETQKKKRQTMDLQLKSFGEGGDIDMSNGSGSGSGSGTGTGDGDAAGGNKGTDVPFACHICRKPFEDPIVTLCGHYFCGRCVLSARSSNKCAVCKKDTFGVFNITDKVVNSKSKSKAKA